MFYELDEKGRFVCDAPNGHADLENWTQTPALQSAYRLRYVGKRLDSGEWVDGKWIDDGPLPLTGHALELSERFWRDGQLRFVDFRINQIEDAKGDASALRAYRQALRDYPASKGFSKGARPEAP